MQKDIKDNKIYHGNSVDILSTLEEKSVDLVWTDPPFNTGKKQQIKSTGLNYDDKYSSISNYLSLMTEVFTSIRPLMKDTGVICVCLDYRSVHDVKVDVLDIIFGPERFLGEIIWHSELGNISKKWWTNKHNTILTYSAGDNPVFNFDNIPRTERKASKSGYEGSKPVNSVWNYTMSNTDPERSGYPNQKPLEIILPFIAAHCNQNSLVLDPFMGSGSTLVAASSLGHRSIGIDCNIDACMIAEKRLNDI